MGGLKSSRGRGSLEGQGGPEDLEMSGSPENAYKARLGRKGKEDLKVPGGIFLLNSWHFASLFPEFLDFYLEIVFLTLY